MLATEVAKCRPAADKMLDSDQESYYAFCGAQRACAIGYEGLLCAMCEPGYGITDTLECQKCRSMGKQMAAVLALLVGSLVIVGNFKTESRLSFTPVL